MRSFDYVFRVSFPDQVMRLIERLAMAGIMMIYEMVCDVR